MDELKLLRRLNFDWVVRSESVWKNPLVDVETIHADAREDLILALEDLEDSEQQESPLGIVLKGIGGSGKTHLLQWLRLQAFQKNMSFVFVDMTGVRDFWETMQLQVIASIYQTLPDGFRQCQHVLAGLLNKIVRKPKKEPIALAHKMAKWSLEQTVEFTKELIANLSKRHRAEMAQYRDVLRALVMLNSEMDELNNAAHAWLHGTETDEDLLRLFEFTSREMASLNTVKGISWLLSLRGPTVLAIDQLDNLAAQQIDRFGSLPREKVAEIIDEDDEARRLLAITHGVMDGFAELVQTAMWRTQVVISCLDTTWRYMVEKARRTAVDRYGQSLHLSPIPTGEATRLLVQGRLAATAEKYGLALPMPSWPFAPEAFEATAGFTPREVLQACDLHRRDCLKKKRVTILSSFDTDGNGGSISTHQATLGPEIQDLPDPFDLTLDEEFAARRESANTNSYGDKNREDRLWPRLLESVLSALVHECTVPPSVDLLVDGEMVGGKSYLYLHGRFRIVDHQRQAREQQFCFRAICHDQANSFQYRLKSAITDAGIDKQLGFRSLTILRNTTPPSGPKTEQLVANFDRMGGRWSSVSDNELRTMLALHDILQSHGAEAHEWIQRRCMVSKLSFIQESGILEAIQDVGGSISEATSPANTPIQEKPVITTLTDDKRVSTTPRQSDLKSTSSSEPVSFPLSTPGPTLVTSPNSTAGARSFQLGVHEMHGGTPGEPINIPWVELKRHMYVVAGAGSGKTNLLKRIIEEAAIVGIPSIVVDCNNDMIQLGDRRPTEAFPMEWTDEDREKERCYTDCREVVTWTPNRNGGNPIALQLLPDFRELADDPDDLRLAIQVACVDIGKVAAPGNSAMSKKKQGVLSKVLEYFAEHGGGPVSHLIGLLRELPMGFNTGIANQSKLAADMADLLQAELNSNPLWDAGGAPLDPTLLFGLNSKKTRISILSMIGLPKQEMQQTFLYQFAIPLLTWIKRNPAPTGKLRGLLVIDEAKEFVPSVQSAVCKEALIRLTAQARKFGLGLIFATQAPKDIDNRIPNNCFTQAYGHVNSPAAIQTAKDFLMQKRASNPGSVASMNKGQFFFYNGELVERAIRIMTPQCLSYHTSPMREDEVIERAIQSREIIGG